MNYIHPVIIPSPPLSLINTARVPFRPCGDTRQALFAVQPGVSVADALEHANSLLDAAEVLALHITNAPNRKQERVSHACHFLLSAAKATVQACIEGTGNEEAAA